MKKCLTKLKFHDHIYICDYKDSIFELVGFEIINKKIYTIMLLGSYHNGYLKRDILITHRNRDLKFSNNINENDLLYWVNSFRITKIILK
jgi:hypothetical protein